MSATKVATQIRSFKRNLEDVLTNHDRAKMRFFVAQPKHRSELAAFWFPPGATLPQVSQTRDEAWWNSRYEDISVEVDAIRTSYFSPALHLNNYLDWSALDVEWDTVKHDIPDDMERPSNVLRRVSGAAYATAVLISIKSGLDRLVRILFFYYAGIANHTTWGRYDQKNAASGFMSTVEKNRHNDPLLAELYDAYHRWIRLAVGPRDALIHYQDSMSVWTFSSEEQALVQSHSITDSGGTVHEYGVEVLSNYVDEWYKLADKVLLDLSLKLPREPKAGKTAAPPLNGGCSEQPP